MCRLSIWGLMAPCTTRQAEGWDLTEDDKSRLSIERTFKTKNFVKVLEAALAHCHPPAHHFWTAS